MADEVKKSIKDEMNSTPSCIPAKWNRFTVADGDWMQAKTMDQLMNRDDFLADKIGEGNSAWKDALSSESAARYYDDQYLSASIFSLSGEFYTFSADDYYPTVTALRYDLNSEIDRATQAESYLAGSISSEETARSAADTKLQKQIDELQAATDVIAVFGTYDEFVAGSGDLGVTDNDTIKVLRDYNYTPSATDEDYESNDDDGFQVYYEWHDPDAEEQHTDWTGWSAIGSLDPYYSVAEIDDYLEQIDDEFDSLSATVANNYLSAKGAVHQGKNIVVTEDTNKPEITISTNADVEFTNVSSTNISATNVTALTATGNSAKFNNISANKISADLFKSDLGTVDTFNLKFISAVGDKLTVNESNAIQLTAGTLYGQSYNSNVDSLIGSAENGEFAYNVINSAKFSAVGTTTSTAYLSGGFAIKAGDNLSLTYADKTITLNAGDTGITAISAGNTQYTGPVFSASAGTGINFVNGNNNVLGIKASDTLINSATGGSAAYNWITGQSATLSAGSGINFNSAAQNTLGISVKYTTTNGYVTELDGIPLSAGANYTQGRCITIDDQNTINLSSDINLNSKLVIDHYNESDKETYATANLESYTLDFSGSRDGGGSFRGQSATYRIDNLKIDNYSDADNLHFAYLDESKLQLSAYSKNGGYSVNTYTNITNDYYETQLAGSPSNYYLKFNGDSISAGSNSSNVTAADWASVVSAANGRFVSATSLEVVVVAPYQTKFVVTSTIPASLNANTYYII